MKLHGFLTNVAIAFNDPAPIIEVDREHVHVQGHEDIHWGMHPALYALIFGIVSGSSLPLASWLGIYMSPVNDRTCALMMAFGAGALLFAVTVELYGHMLSEVAHGRVGLYEIFTTVFGALLGAAFYLTVNQWLEEYLMHDQTVETNELEDKEDKANEAPVMAALHKQEQQQLPEKRSGSALWGKAMKALPDSALKVRKTLSLMNKEALKNKKGREMAMRMAMDPAEVQHAKSVAFALFLGLLVDGIPEGILMGFLSAEGHLTPVLIISLFVANFPEAFSSSSLLVQAQMSIPKIICMWTGLCLLVGCLAGGSCYTLLWMFPKFGQPGVHEGKLPMGALVGIALTEGITGGAMIACISSVMLPEAFERAGKTGKFYAQSGFWCVCGFLLSVTLKALCG